MNTGDTYTGSVVKSLQQDTEPGIKTPESLKRVGSRSQSPPKRTKARPPSSQQPSVDESRTEFNRGSLQSKGRLWNPDDPSSSARPPSYDRSYVATNRRLPVASGPNSISQEQLVAEVKGIYAGLVMVENKCIEVDTAQNRQNDTNITKYDNEKRQASTSLRRPLLQHVDLILASQDPSASPAPRRLASKYAMPVELYKPKKTVDFSSGQKQYFIAGNAGGSPVEALPDSGADANVISLTLAATLGLKVTPGTAKMIQLPKGIPVQSPGMVEVPWTFAGEAKKHLLSCWVLPGCVHDLVLGNSFLRATQTLTNYLTRRIKHRLITLPKRLGLHLLGEERQRLRGYLNGHLTSALADTGSDVMLLSTEYARKVGLLADSDQQNRLEVEFADGSTAWTSGVVWDVPWTVGDRTLRCDFHILDDLCVDVVLSKDYLFETNVFAEHGDSFFNIGGKDEDDSLQLCNIRLISRYGDVLSGLEDEYLEDGK